MAMGAHVPGIRRNAAELPLDCLRTTSSVRRGFLNNDCIDLSVRKTVVHSLTTWKNEPCDVCLPVVCLWPMVSTRPREKFNHLLVARIPDMAASDAMSDAVTTL
eukprot:COSAG02_NODE_32251_length_519_cov_0.983333_1_plen_103_part_01